MNESIEKMITDSLVKRYEPKAVILCGSRARGEERPKSDWDIALIFDGRFDGQEVSMIEGQFIDLEYIDGKADPETIAKKYGIRFLDAKVLFESGDAGSVFLSEVNASASKGPCLGAEEIDRKLNFVKRSIVRLEHYLDDEVVFYYHMGELYSRLVKFWYLFRNEWSKPIQLAVHDISKRDQGYFTQLSLIANDEHRNEIKLDAAKGAYKILLDVEKQSQ